MISALSRAGWQHRDGYGRGSTHAGRAVKAVRGVIPRGFEPHRLHFPCAPRPGCSSAESRPAVERDGPCRGAASPTPLAILRPLALGQPVHGAVAEFYHSLVYLEAPWCSGAWPPHAPSGELTWKRTRRWPIGDRSCDQKSQCLSVLDLPGHAVHSSELPWWS